MDPIGCRGRSLSISTRNTVMNKYAMSINGDGRLNHLKLNSVRNKVPSRKIESVKHTLKKKLLVKTGTESLSDD